MASSPGVLASSDRVLGVHQAEHIEAKKAGSKQNQDGAFLFAMGRNASQNRSFLTASYGVTATGATASSSNPSVISASRINPGLIAEHHHHPSSEEPVDSEMVDAQDDAVSDVTEPTIPDIDDTKTSPWVLDSDRQVFVLSWNRELIEVPVAVFQDLYIYQRAGIAWMADLHHKETGGILGE